MRFCHVAMGLLLAGTASAQARPRAHDLGVPIAGTRGQLNGITDVGGVEVGHTTLISGTGQLIVGTGPVRTGVTVIHPRGRANGDPVLGAWFTLNGNGEMTGTTWVEESGVVEGPIAITNTHSVGVVRDAIIAWQMRRPGSQPWALPIVAETYDGFVSDINGFHVKPEHVFTALDGARAGAVQEGNVGGGTGMVCLQFKGGIGTASRTVDIADGSYTVGVLVQCNFGGRPTFQVAGVPVGQEITDFKPCFALSDVAIPPGARARRCADARPSPSAGAGEDGAGSIIVVIATDAPLLPHQLKRIATRASLGVARTGGVGENGSGDIFLAFSTANARAAESDGVRTVQMLPNDLMNPLFHATVAATEEAILSAMLAAETMEGANGLRIHALPLDRLRTAMAKYGRPLRR